MFTCLSNFLCHVCSHPPQTLPQHRITASLRTPAGRTMKVSTLQTLSCTAVLLLLPLLTSCHPATAPQSSDQSSLVLIQLNNPALLGYNWKNVSCHLCKALFTILDVALLVIDVIVMFWWIECWYFITGLFLEEVRMFQTLSKLFLSISLIPFHICLLSLRVMLMKSEWPRLWERHASVSIWLRKKFAGK